MQIAEEQAAREYERFGLHAWTAESRIRCFSISTTYATSRRRSANWCIEGRRGPSSRPRSINAKSGARTAMRGRLHVTKEVTERKPSDCDPGEDRTRKPSAS